MNWKNVFYYDESSPSCLRWAINIYHSSQFGISDVIKIHKGSVAGGLSLTENRWKVKYQQKQNKVHRIVYEILNGELSDDLLIDHINGDASDNRISNLRAVSTKINSRNLAKTKNNKTGGNWSSI